MGIKSPKTIQRKNYRKNGRIRKGRKWIINIGEFISTDQKTFRRKHDLRMSEYNEIVLKVMNGEYIII